MRKMNYLLGALALGVGVLAGTLGLSLFASSSSPSSFISKLRGEDKIQPVSGVVSNQTQPAPNQNIVADDLAQNGLENHLNEPEKEDTLKDHKGDSVISQKVIADYKQDIGIFFGAWKSTDMATFRQKLAKAYTGDLFEKHARRAEEYLVQGIGLDVSGITFDQVDVESIGENTATLRVDYRYTARDYNLTDGVVVGDEHEQIVQVRVNLVKQNSRWLITGESTIQ